MAITPDDKEKLKRAVAQSLVHWLCQTRHDLRQDLAAGIQPHGAAAGQSKWEGLSVVTALGADINTFADNLSLHSYSNNEVLNHAAQTTHLVAETDWRQSIEGLSPEAEPIAEDCPVNPIINAMFDAAVAYINAL